MSDTMYVLYCLAISLIIPMVVVTVGDWIRGR